MPKYDIFHHDFQEKPYWWEAYQPASETLTGVPAEARVAIIGAGYAGLATALELHKLGIEAVVFDAEVPGYGASTRSGGVVGGRSSIKQRLIGKEPCPGQAAAMETDAANGLALMEKLITEESIDCGWTRGGRFLGAWSPKHFESMQTQAAMLNEHGQANAEAVPRARQREEIGSDFYYGGLTINEGGHVHPALYFKGLYQACEKRGVGICAQAPVRELRRHNNGWLIKTARGEMASGDVVIATNGYTGDITPTFKRRLVPLRPYMIATESLPGDLARNLSPKNRAFSDSQRIVAFFRLSSDGRRMIFGSRVKWTDISGAEMAAPLYDIMIARYPQLAGYKVTHAWHGNVALTLDERPHTGMLDGLHYALGCNGSGVAMMTYLGTQVARKIARAANYTCAFDSDFPDHPLYNGNSRWFLPLVGNYLRARDWFDRNLG